jgi:K+/H+ antiporter YhaU regulatory subunit KhtT
LELLTWSDPKYLVYATALIKSIRYHNNNNLIHFCLLDFNNEQFETVREIFRNDSKINFIQKSSQNHHYQVKDARVFNPDVNNGKIQFYRNFRPRLFLDVLKESDGKICTFGANGIVNTDLSYISEILDKKDFVFMEREKNDVFSKNNKKVNKIEDIVSLVNSGIEIDEILKTTTGKVVLLGTHAMKNNKNVQKVLKKWISLIENTDKINKKFSDMNLFVKAYSQTLIEGYKITKETGWETEREKNPFCDTHLIEGSNIWFAKGENKFTNKKYLDAVRYFLKYDYSL